MTKTVVIEEFESKEIEYKESFFTTKKSFTFDGKPCKKREKNVFSFDYEGVRRKIKVKGNYIFGSSITVNKKEYEIFPKTQWWEYAAAGFIFALILILGNIPAIANAFPIIGGVIGGALGGIIGGLLAAICGAFALCLERTFDKLWIKILIFVGFLLLAILVCFFVGSLALEYMV